MSKLIFEGLTSTGGNVAGELFMEDSSGQYVPISLNGAAANYIPQVGDELGFIGGAVGPEMITLDGSVFLQAYDQSSQYGLFVYTPASGGNPAQSVELGKQSAPNSFGIDPTDFVVYDNHVYFNGKDQSNDSTLYVIDGLNTGSTPANASNATLRPIAQLDPSSMVAYDGDLYMNDGADNLIAYNDASSTPFTSIAQGLNPSDMTVGTVGTIIGAAWLTTLPTDLFMNAPDGQGNGLWVYNSSNPNSLAEIAAGPNRITDAQGNHGIDPVDIVAMDSSYSLTVNKFESYHVDVDAVYFSGVDSSGQRGLWISQGTSASTTEIKGTSGLDPYDLTALNGDLYFTGNDGTRRGLFVYIPETGKVTEVAGPHSTNAATNGLDLTDGYQSSWGNLNQNTITVSNGDLYFGAAHYPIGQNVNLYEASPGGTATNPTITVSKVQSNLMPQSLTTV
jgi:ELWxxDGT repeat protein